MAQNLLGPLLRVVRLELLVMQNTPDTCMGDVLLMDNIFSTC